MILKGISLLPLFKLIQEYDIQSANDLQDTLKDLLGDTIQEMMEAEMTEYLGYDKYERSDSTNSKNGRKSKTIRSKYDETTIEVPQDREASFKPKVVKKRQKDISAIDNKIISMYAKGLRAKSPSKLKSSKIDLLILFILLSLLTLSIFLLEIMELLEKKLHILF